MKSVEGALAQELGSLPSDAARDQVRNRAHIARGLVEVLDNAATTGRMFRWDLMKAGIRKLKGHGLQRTLVQ